MEAGRRWILFHPRTLHIQHGNLPISQEWCLSFGTFLPHLSRKARGPRSDVWSRHPKVPAPRLLSLENPTISSDVLFCLCRMPFPTTGRTWFGFVTHVLRLLVSSSHDRQLTLFSRPRTFASRASSSRTFTTPFCILFDLATRLRRRKRSEARRAFEHESSRKCLAKHVRDPSRINRGVNLGPRGCEPFD